MAKVAIGKEQSQSKGLAIFITFWLIISLLQAYFTPLHYDEAYYYAYSQHLAWGYFDHPPLVALFIKVGYTFFQNELGVRLLTVLSSGATIYLLYDLARCCVLENDRKQYLVTFILLIISSVVLSMYSFITTPDAPFLFFGTLFLWLFQRFSSTSSNGSKREGKEDSPFWGSGCRSEVLLSLTAACVLYSKYHGVVLFGCIVAANPSLLKQVRFYRITFLTILFFLPHLYWQYSHNFPSITYHLKGRNEQHTWVWRYVWEYPLNQWVMFSPLVAFFIFRSVVKTTLALNKNSETSAMATTPKPYNDPQFVRTLVFIFWGFLGFFFLMTFRGHVEPHWTAMAIIPAIILTLNFEFQTASWKLKKIPPPLRRRLGGSKLSAILLFIIRIALIFNFFPQTGISDPTQWIKTIENAAGGKQVVFIDSYKKAALYSFYARTDATTIHTANKRSSQFEIWNKTSDNHFKNAYFVAEDPNLLVEPTKINKKEFGSLQIKANTLEP